MANTEEVYSKATWCTLNAERKIDEATENIQRSGDGGDDAEHQLQPRLRHEALRLGGAPRAENSAGGSKQPPGHLRRHAVRR